MTSPRRDIVDPAVAGHYHCVARCVRRAFLCGVDGYTGMSFEHRKEWIEQRILELARYFAVGIYAYAVMSNHLHLVVHVDPGVAMAWSAEEVARRWVGVFPVRVAGMVDEQACAGRTAVIAADPVRVAICRERLANLSWFMRCLCEPIARRANREDGCTGRFWEGRYKCQALLDDRAVLACMAYVDLNPIRAGLCETLHDAAHTSIPHRTAACADPQQSRSPIPPVAGVDAEGAPAVTIAEYIALVDWTGRQLHPGKRGRITDTAPDAVRHLVPEPEHWVRSVAGIEEDYWRAVGTVDALLAKAEAMGQCWLKGLGVARKLRPREAAA
jgi:REP element-mobilizing transposase RayT